VTLRARRNLAVAGVCVAFVAVAGIQQSSPNVFGFTRDGAGAERRLEDQFLLLPDTARLIDAHKFLTAKPHMAGSPRDRELADWTARNFTAAGLEDVQISTHDVLLPWPIEVSVDMTSPRRWRASMREEPVPGDAYSDAPTGELGVPYHAYSASGEVTAEVVYAGSGNPSDYDWLASKGVDIRGRIALVRYSVPYSYRGFKALTAQQRGAAGILIYSDPADDGEGKGKVYPEGPWGPPSHIQRGGIVYDFMVPGDPLTPGWASTPGARRIDRADAVSLPRIISAPLSNQDAKTILESLGGEIAPKAWQGGLPIKYRVGAGPATVRLRVRSDDVIRPIWTVTGRISGREYPEELVIVGNHRDAWVYGGVDPSSGSAALVELASTLGQLVKRGWRPKRTIVLASWDAEEFTLTSSTEWGEEHRDRLREHAVAYLNVDSAASGPHFAAAAVPSLTRLIGDVAEIVRDPRLRIPVAAAARSKHSEERGALPTGGGEDLVNNRLGSGSDYTVFLNHLGVPVADLSFDGPYGVYHSMYDNHNWVSRIGDPGFQYHAALVKIWGLVTLRLANADAIPLDPSAYADRLGDFVKDLRRRPELSREGADPRLSEAVKEIESAIGSLRASAAVFGRRRDAALAGMSGDALISLNRKALRFERMFLSTDGIPGRPWYRHLVYAPKYTYAPEIFPGVSEGLDAQDTPRAVEQARRLAAAIRRASELLRE
jgi:N-acetylated-alpha-linked acidic dipeptidase